MRLKAGKTGDHGNKNFLARQKYFKQSINFLNFFSLYFRSSPPLNSTLTSTDVISKFSARFSCFFSSIRL